jgi:hypothetical protein
MPMLTVNRLNRVATSITNQAADPTTSPVASIGKWRRRICFEKCGCIESISFPFWHRSRWATPILQLNEHCIEMQVHTVPQLSGTAGQVMQLHVDERLSRRQDDH